MVIYICTCVGSIPVHFTTIGEWVVKWWTRQALFSNDAENQPSATEVDDKYVI